MENVELRKTIEGLKELVVAYSDELERVRGDNIRLTRGNQEWENVFGDWGGRRGSDS